MLGLFLEYSSTFSSEKENEGGEWGKKKKEKRGSINEFRNNFYLYIYIYNSLKRMNHYLRFMTQRFDIWFNPINRLNRKSVWKRKEREKRKGRNI